MLNIVSHVTKVLHYVYFILSSKNQTFIISRFNWKSLHDCLAELIALDLKGKGNCLIGFLWSSQVLYVLCVWKVIFNDTL